MKLEKLSSLALYICIILGAVCFAFFYLWDYGLKDAAEHTSPKFTDLLLFLMYALAATTILLTVGSVVKGIKVNMGTKGPNPTGIPSGMVTVCTWVTVLASLVIGYVMGIGSEQFTTTSGAVTSAGMVQVSEMFLWSIYILAIITVIAVVVCMTGFLSRSASKK